MADISLKVLMTVTSSLENPISRLAAGRAEEEIGGGGGRGERGPIGRLSSEETGLAGTFEMSIFCRSR